VAVVQPVRAADADATRPIRRYLCPKCGQVGIPDPDYTLMDARYAPGRCPNKQHPKARMILVREDVVRA